MEKKIYNMYVRKKLVKKKITKGEAILEFDRRIYKNDSSFELKLNKPKIKR